MKFIKKCLARLARLKFFYPLYLKMNLSEEQTTILSRALELGQRSGAYTLKDASMIAEAKKKWNKEKEITSNVIAVTIQAVQIAQAKGSWSLEDTTTIFPIIVHLEEALKKMSEDK